MAAPKMVFTGTGTSCGIPLVSCLCGGHKYNWDGQRRNVVVDVGKFWWHSALEVFPAHAVDHLDAVILTHCHTDACGGLDDLRDFGVEIPVLLRKEDFEAVSLTHYYLVRRSARTTNTVATLRFLEIDRDTPFVVSGLRFTPLPVWHGRNYEAIGFRFGSASSPEVH
eukprot:m51a1_g3474 hypothetical protein (167) ;mRNA; r:758234-758935